MDLFENPLNGNGKYMQPIPKKGRDLTIQDFEEQFNNVSGNVADIDARILPCNSVEVWEYSVVFISISN